MSFGANPKPVTVLLFKCKEQSFKINLINLNWNVYLILELYTAVNVNKLSSNKYFASANYNVCFVYSIKEDIDLGQYIILILKRCKNFIILQSWNGQSCLLQFAIDKMNDQNSK